MSLPHNPLEGEQPDLTIKLHNGVDDQVSIIIVHKDRPDYLSLCLGSIMINSASNNIEIIVVDNNSTTQDALDYLEEIEKDVKLIRNPVNSYWSDAANKGAEAASKLSPYLIFLHCDTVILDPSWIDILVNVSDAQKSGLIGTDVQSYYVETTKMDFIQEWCVLLTRECWKDIGPWPTELPFVGSAFMMTMKAARMGHKPQGIRNKIVHHYRMTSLSANEYSKFCANARMDLPKLMNQMNLV